MNFLGHASLITADTRKLAPGSPGNGPEGGGNMTTGQVTAAVAASLDGFIAGPDDSPEQPLGLGGEQLFTWFEDGSTPGRFYPWMSMSPASAGAFDGFIARIGAVITGRRTYDIARAWEGQGEVPGAPLFVVTRRIPDQVPPADPP